MLLTAYIVVTHVHTTRHVSIEALVALLTHTHTQADTTR